jgi:hypothetical protein
MTAVCLSLPFTTRDWFLFWLSYWLLFAEQSRSLLPAISRHSHSRHLAPVGPVAIYLLLVTVTVLFLWGALSDERSGLSFICAAGPCPRNLSLVRVPWDSRPYFTVSDLRLPFSSPPTTRRVTVENTVSNSTSIVTCVSVAAGTCLLSCCLETMFPLTMAVSQVPQVSLWASMPQY